MTGGNPKSRARARCGRCGEALLVRALHPTIEKPFAQCERCGAFLAREGANEWDLLAPRARLAHGAHVATRASAAGLGAALAPLVASLAQREPWRVEEVLPWLATGFLLVGGWELARLVRAIRRSRRRLADPMYRARLIEFELLSGSQR